MVADAASRRQSEARCASAVLFGAWMDGGKYVGKVPEAFWTPVDALVGSSDSTCGVLSIFPFSVPSMEGDGALDLAIGAGCKCLCVKEGQSSTFVPSCMHCIAKDGLGVSGRDGGCEGVGAGEPNISFVVEASTESQAFLNGLLCTVELAGSVGLRNGVGGRSISEAESNEMPGLLDSVSWSFLVRATCVSG